MKTPQNVSFLERGIRSLVDSNDKAYRLRVLMADVIVGQFLDGALSARRRRSSRRPHGRSPIAMFLLCLKTCQIRWSEVLKEVSSCVLTRRNVVKSYFVIRRNVMKRDFLTRRNVIS